MGVFLVVSKNIAFLAAALFAFILIFGCVQGPGAAAGSTTGGSVVSVQPIDYTTDTSIPFSKVWTANVVLDGGGNYLYGSTSAPVQGTSQNGQIKSSETFTVKYQLNSLYCSYPLSADRNTLSYLAVKSYEVPNSNNFWAGNPWSASCRIAAAVNSFFQDRIYYRVQTGIDGFNNPIYCNAMPTSICNADYANLCQGQQGFKAVPCTIPNSQTDAVLQSIFGSNIYSGYSCVKVQDRDPAVADFTVQSPVSKSVKISADVTTQKQSGASETISLTEANNYQGHSSNVYAKSTYSVNSYNPGCDEYSTVSYVQTRFGTSGVYASSEYSTLKSAYTTALNTARNAVTLDSFLQTIDEYDSRVAYSFTTVKSDFSYFNVGSGELRADRSQNPPAYPAIQLYINADWLGVVNPVSVPQLSQVQPDPVTFTSGQQGTGTFTVTNAGQAGGISVSLPTCTPAATFTWTNDPNRNYNAGAPYSASFKATANQGSYSCTINAQSSGYNPSGNYNPTSTTFSMNVAQQCTNSASPPRYRCPTDAEPCKVCCPLDPAIAGFDACAQNGLLYNSTQCACVAKPDCALTNTCPVESVCSDGTAVGICNTDGKRCNLVQNVATLQTDGTCNSVVPPVAACLPLIQAGADCHPDIIGYGLVLFIIMALVWLYEKFIGSDDEEIKKYAVALAALGLLLVILGYLMANLFATIGVFGILAVFLVSVVLVIAAVKLLL